GDETSDEIIVEAQSGYLGGLFDNLAQRVGRQGPKGLYPRRQFRQVSVFRSGIKEFGSHRGERLDGTAQRRLDRLDELGAVARFGLGEQLLELIDDDQQLRLAVGLGRDKQIGRDGL